jgi:regulator of nucleoside diphosphate kinase
MNDMIAKTAAAARKPPLLIDSAHSTKLEDLALRAMRRMPSVARRLLEEVQRADVRPASELPPNVVRIGSEVTYRDDAGGVKTVRLVFPENADIAAHRVSVLTPIGVALIGLSVGQTISWETPEGKLRELTALSVA